MAGQDDMLKLFIQKGGDFILKDQIPITGWQDWKNLYDDIVSGNFVAAAELGATMATTILSSAIGGPVGLAIGAFFAGIEAIEFAYGGAITAYTVPGCGGTFGLPESPIGNPFTWSFIGGQFEYVPPQGNIPSYTFPWSGMTDWTNGNWLCDYPQGSGSAQCYSPAGTDPTRPGGPGSFEALLQTAMMAAWDKQANASAICDLMKHAGTDGNIGKGGDALVSSIWRVLMAQAGALIPPLVYAWNQTHSAGTITWPEARSSTLNCQTIGTAAGMNALQQFCSSKGAVAGDGQGAYCDENGNLLCTFPAQQRKITYTVTGGASGLYVQSADPLQLAFDGLAALAGIPAGSTISVMINSGPPIGTTTSPHVRAGGSIRTTPTMAGTTPSTSGGWFTGLVIVGGLATIALEVYAYRQHMTLVQASKQLWMETKNKFHRTPRLRPSTRTRRH